VKDWNILINLLDEEFFKDIPKEITKNNIENWITKKIEYLQLWELYSKLKDEFALPKLSGENKNMILDELKRLEEYGMIYPKYVEIQYALSKYLKNVESLNCRELNEILLYLAEFDDIKYYDTLKNDINSNEMELLKYLNEYSKDELINTYYYMWIDYIESKPHIFKVVKKIDEYNHIKKELEELYGTKFLKTRKHIQKILKRINLGNEARNKIPYEANKKRRRKPLKEILELYEEDVLNIIPIWLTTPDVVSAIFPLKKELFDIVIYDEASQMPMEYALPPLYRAKRFVIAGDEKQLPPTDFFRASFDEDDDEIDGMDELEVKSLLELCKTRCPTVLLSYHYRSRYEEIINFSNYAYYNGKIAISPNKHRGKPFEFIKVKGRWENRKNYVEAKKVVEKVHELLKKNSEKSIGIITFNSEHKDLIMDELEKKALEDERFKTLYEKSLNLKKDNEDMSLFVRNIENVQGDERDIIIFSTAYAKDENDKLNHNFGPLNRVGGENRLNVAITRAKEKVIIITSIEPEDLKVETLKNEGPKLLKKYMQYVKFISNGDYANAEIILNSLCDVEKLNELQFDSPFEEEVYDELTKRGHIVHTQVGCSKYRIDLAMKHPKEDKYILGIECDGATYHSSRSAKERDLYRQRFLEMKGWKIIRIWSRNWWKNREKEILRIEKEITKNL
jgi:very-short-patch-repair endonuclease